MTRSPRSNSFRFPMPKITPFTFVVLLLAALFAIHSATNKAQDAPQNAPTVVVDEPVASQETKSPEQPVTDTATTEEADGEPLPGDSEGDATATDTTATEEAVPPVQPEAGPTEEVFPVVEETASEGTAAVTTGEAADEAEKTEEPRTNFLQSGYFTWLIFLLIALGCFWLGNVLAKFWRLPEHNVRIFILLLAFFGSIVAVAMGWNRLTLGIDLQGGVVLIYDVTPNATEDGQTQAATIETQTMEKLVTAISGRINPGGVREISITPRGLSQIQVIIPKAEDAEVERIQRVITESGALTFRIMASTSYSQDEPIIARAQRETGSEVRDASGKLLARWVPVMKGEESQFVGSRDSATFVSRTSRGELEMLVLFNDGADVTGELLEFVGRGTSEKGEPGVSFTFNGTGESRFRRLTRANQPDASGTMMRHLSIILNDHLYSAPVINSVIGKHGIITFATRNTEEGRQQLDADIQHLIDVLDAGALPADLGDQPASKQQIGATLGTETIRQGSLSLIASAAVVLLFMLMYYRLAGFIACFCVITNITLLVAIMLSIRAAFTLPGLAGIVLTIGMAVDANILIYERLREELTGGASLKMAIRNAYAKALSAIVDSNITTILTGVILYTVGTEQVKGFAVTLVLGVALSMFTSIYCARTIMDIMEACRLKTFKMVQLFKRPNINFLGMSKACAIFSIVISVASLLAVFGRGKTILDIDFVGGVSVELVFHDSQTRSYVSETLMETDRKIQEVGKDESYRLNDLSVQEFQTEDANATTSEFGKFRHFTLTTSVPQIPGVKVSQDEYLKTVRNIVKDSFGDKLVYSKFNYTLGESQVVEERTETTVAIQVFPEMSVESVESVFEVAIKNAVQAKLIENDFGFIVNQADIESDGNTVLPDWTLTLQTTPEIAETILTQMKSELNDSPYFPSSTTVGSSVASDTRIQGFLAILGSLVCIALYIWFRFSRLTFGTVAVIGLIHDVVVVLGLIAVSAWIANWAGFLLIFEFKIGLTVVAAFLTIIGYSLNDTIILFDRIRENKGKSPLLTGQMINNAINQTLSRTVLTSLTTFAVAIILYIWGGPGIHTFAFAMSIGVAFGTYSTIFVCAPLLYWWLGSETPQKK